MEVKRKVWGFYEMDFSELSGEAIEQQKKPDEPIIHYESLFKILPERESILYLVSLFNYGAVESDYSAVY